MLCKPYCLYYISLQLSLHFMSLLLLPNSCSSFGTHLRGFHCYKAFTVIIQPSSSSSGLLLWNFGIRHCAIFDCDITLNGTEKYLRNVCRMMRVKMLPCLLPYKTYKICINIPFGRCQPRLLICWLIIWLKSYNYYDADAL